VTLYVSLAGRHRHPTGSAKLPLVRHPHGERDGPGTLARISRSGPARAGSRQHAQSSELGLLGGLIGARLYYVAFNLDYYLRFPGKIFAVWEGGLAIHGGVLGGLLVGGGYALLRGLPAVTYLDIAAPSIALDRPSAVGVTFSNEEAFGTPTNLPWRLFISPPHRPIQFAQDEYFHPTFLYESIWDFVVFLLLFLVFRRRFERAPGALFLTYLGLYSVGRFMTEALRTDALMLGPLRVAQLASVVGVVLALIGVPMLLRRTRAAA
jgi:phosphatidylglycerol:prolipoprotein diacylglycerol transferase